MSYNLLKGLRRHTNADISTNTKLNYPEHASDSGLCSVCVMCGKCEVSRKAREGKCLIPEPFGSAQFAAEKRVPNLGDIQILPEILGKGIDFTKVNTKVEIGGLKCDLPLVMAAMGSTDIAHLHKDILSEGAALAGIPRVIGENVYITHGRKALSSSINLYKKHAKKTGGIIVQVNANEHKLGLAKLAKRLGADAIEIKLGQGAKQNLGGEIIFKDKKRVNEYKKLGYTIIKRDSSFERHGLPGDITEEDLRAIMSDYQKVGLPIWVKVGIGVGITKLINILDELKHEQDIPINCLTVDGFGGGTGMAPWEIMNEVGLPSGSLFSVLTVKPSFDIILAGGFASGSAIAKALMLGADGVAMGRPFLIASKVKLGIPNFCKALKEELRFICATQKVENVAELYKRKKNLFALTRSCADIFGINYELKRLY